jgi:hypothetical protein
MKKHIILLLTAFLLINVSCQDELERDFINPGVYSPTANVPAGMFAAMMQRERTFKNDYGEFWWQANTGGILNLSHLSMRPLRNDLSYFAELNDPKIRAQLPTLDSYFYGHNYDFRELPVMEGLVEKMTGAEKSDNEIYVALAKMVRGYRASKAVDLYNSVPYSEGLAGVQGSFFPKFDDPKEIYKSIIDDLGSLSAQLSQLHGKMSSDGKRIFNQQDIIFQGNVTKWEQWANALRLRLAVRISGVEEAYAKQVIGEIISKGMLPATDLFISNALWVSKDADHWKRGLNERDYAMFMSPTFLYKLDRDKNHLYTEGVDDPRLPVFFLPNRDRRYQPMPYDFNVGQIVYNRIIQDNVTKYGFNNAIVPYIYCAEVESYLKYNLYCLYSPTTYIRNQEPWRAFTRAEVDLLLAEVQLKGLANTGASAETHVRNSVVNSINYWYYINSFSNWDKINDSNRSFLKPTPPSQSLKEQYADKVAADYTNASGNEEKMGVIIGQKYVHLNIHDYFEVFSELRRTRHPKLPLIKFTTGAALMPMYERYPYPGSEASINKDAIAAVADQDNFTSPIFWVPADKRNVKFYEDTFNNDYLYNRYPGIPESFPPN